MPALSLAFGYAALVPLGALAVLVWLVPERRIAGVVWLAIVWGVCLVAFFAGVRRGVSFRTEGGPTFGQIGAMLALFVTAVLALLVPSPIVALALITAAFAGLAIIDPEAAEAGDVPLHFRRLRPLQMTLAVAALASVLLGVVVLG